MLLAIQSALGYLFYAVYIPFLFSSGEFQRSGVSAGLLEIILPFGVLLAVAMNVGFYFSLAGIFHLVLSILGGARKGFEATYKGGTYSNAAWRPAFGPCLCLIGAIFFFFFAMIIGLPRRH